MRPAALLSTSLCDLSAAVVWRAGYRGAAPVIPERAHADEDYCPDGGLGRGAGLGLEVGPGVGSGVGEDALVGVDAFVGVVLAACACGWVLCDLACAGATTNGVASESAATA
jgi:hypothetical protein